MLSLRLAAHFAVGSLVLLASCRPPEAATAGEPASSASAAPSAKDDNLPPALPGLEKEVLATGTGPEVKKGDHVLVHYTGTLVDGTKFDSSVDRGTPFDFEVGKGQVIVGWELGVVGMQRGSKWKLTIPPHIGYGSTGHPPKIPPDATLIFVIELVDIIPPES
jgi:FKBP-type peptidyl-prolyl cis-trans isomerase